MKIRGLTLIRPWGYAIAHLGKDIENRNWKCYLKKGDYIAIHNGKKWDRSAVECMAAIGVHSDITKDQDEDSQIIAVARFAGNYEEHDSVWFVGDIGWQLEDVTPIKPVSCKGQQGLWELSSEVLGRVRINYSMAKKLSYVELLGGEAQEESVS